MAKLTAGTIQSGGDSTGDSDELSKTFVLATFL